MKYLIAGLSAALLVGLLSVAFLPGIIEWVPASRFVSGDLVWVLEEKANVGDNWHVEVTITWETITDCQGTYYSVDRNFRLKGPCADVEIEVNKQVQTRAAPSFSV